ncbi:MULTISPECIES: DUF1673 domain-containing protein [unclassified Methanosarcina]|uniref:DUF1673 domain-containing protein n=1 Tax=unclassified Methanosarcina TaxID=2644672 RepID=UPI0006155F09|nr:MULTISPECIES: DUF1673 domain-containing protein [unclassified Methanosarcina]AKB18794.1 hypothetical protein MSWHS_1931 [Methanosarcina sp. WWM596]AKB23306.1 hypothetical protein MSWH1_3035 [Methanosarcina sp. WH1]
MSLEYIKKLMGWCPNAKTLETGPRISPANFEAYAQSGGEKARTPGVLNQFSRLFSRFDVRILLPMIFITPFYINSLFRTGVNAEALLLGLSLSLLIYLLGWKKQMRQYDTLAKKPFIASSFKKTLFWIFLVLILGLILPMVFLSYILSYIPSFLNAQSLYSFIAGAWILMGGTYLQLIYWERKNHMKIYIKSEGGFQKLYALGEKAGEL